MAHLTKHHQPRLIIPSQRALVFPFYTPQLLFPLEVGSVRMCGCRLSTTSTPHNTHCSFLFTLFHVLTHVRLFWVGAERCGRVDRLLPVQLSRENITSLSAMATINIFLPTVRMSTSPESADDQTSNGKGWLKANLSRRLAL